MARLAKERRLEKARDYAIYIIEHKPATLTVVSKIFDVSLPTLTNRLWELSSQQGNDLKLFKKMAKVFPTVFINKKAINKYIQKDIQFVQEKKKKPSYTVVAYNDSHAVQYNISPYYSKNKLNVMKKKCKYTKHHDNGIKRRYVLAVRNLFNNVLEPFNVIATSESDAIRLFRIIKKHYNLNTYSTNDITVVNVMTI